MLNYLEIERFYGKETFFEGNNLHQNRSFGISLILEVLKNLHSFNFYTFCHLPTKMMFRDFSTSLVHLKLIDNHDLSYTIIQGEFMIRKKKYKIKIH